MFRHLRSILAASLVCLPVTTALGQDMSACCAPGGCIELTEKDCGKAGGDWLPGVVCADEPCGSPITFVPSDLGPGDQYHVAFITDSATDGQSADIADYNVFVSNEANAGDITQGWGVDWFAIVSTPTVDARDNLPVDTAPIYLLSDERLADDASDLWDGTIQTLFDINQDGAFESSQTVWTGSLFNGTVFLGGGLGTDEPRTGFNGESNPDWVDFGNDPQEQLKFVYAVSEVLTVPGAAVGACCLGDGGCVVETEDACSGDYQGDGTDCFGPCPVACPGDTNDDGLVDVTDLMNIILCWGTTGVDCPEPGVNTDLVPDGEVNVDDQLAVIEGWGACE